MSHCEIKRDALNDQNRGIRFKKENTFSLFMYTIMKSVNTSSLQLSITNDTEYRIASCS